MNRGTADDVELGAGVWAVSIATVKEAGGSKVPRVPAPLRSMVQDLHFADQVTHPGHAKGPTSRVAPVLLYLE